MMCGLLLLQLFQIWLLTPFGKLFSSLAFSYVPFFYLFKVLKNISFEKYACFSLKNEKG